MHQDSSYLAWTLFILAIVSGGVAIGLGAGNGLNTLAGLAAEEEFAFTLALWAFVWGIVLIVMFLAFANDGYQRRCEMYVRGPGWLSWFWTLLMVFLAGPWNFFGHIFLLRAFTAVDATATALYVMSIIALVINWFIVLAMLRYSAFVLFVHNWQIGVTRRYLTSTSDAARSGRSVPILDERYRVLPDIMRAMDAGSKRV